MCYSRAFETIANSLVIAEAGREAGKCDRFNNADF
jgi:hypothetical protein